MALGLTDDQKEMLAELRDHPCWLLFWDKVVGPALITEHVAKVMEATRNGDARLATYEQGLHDGIIDVLAALYRAIDGQIPQHVYKLRRESKNG